MRLYVKNKFGKKIILDVKASTRFELASKIGTKFWVGNEIYRINQVFAESSTNETANGAAIGGIIGLLGGGVGVVVGGLIGGMIGNTNDKEEMKKVRTFNNSRYEKNRL